MALTGLDIFKLLPKTNCKKCGMPTCLAFAMQLAQKRAKLESCPEVSEEAKQKLAAAAAPPMRKIAFGSGDAQVQTGQETVLFRHDEKFHSPTIVAITVSDKLTGSALQERIKAVKALQFERVGTHVGIKAAAVVNENGSPDTFAQVCAAVKDGTDLALSVSHNRGTGVTTLQWIARPQPAPLLGYDVFLGSVPPVDAALSTLTALSCDVGAGTPPGSPVSVNTAAVPALGKSFYFLVGHSNTVPGSRAALGRASSGTVRVSPVGCP